MESWRQYGGFYRMVDFTREWTYTPPPPAPVEMAMPQTATGSTLPLPPESFSSASSQHGHHQLYDLYNPNHEHPLRHPQHSQHHQHHQHHQYQPQQHLLQQQQNNQDGSSWVCTVPTSLPRNCSTGDLSDSLAALRSDVDVQMSGDSIPRSGHYDAGPSLLRPSLHSTVTSTDRESVTFSRLAGLQAKEGVGGSKRPFGLVKKWFSSVKGTFGKRRKIRHRRFDLDGEDREERPGEEMRRRPISMSLSLAAEKRPPSIEFASSVDEGQEPEYLDGWRRPLDLWEWKAWGYYARPWISGVFVTNYPPCSDTTITDDMNVEAIAGSLVDEDGTEHSERWIPGLSHPCLPPRPLRWASDPRPYWPSQCELNPYLRRKIVGAPPLFWDMGKEPATAVHGHSLVATPLLPSDRAQPATWPMTTHLFINALADDVELRWPILIKNKWGVTVQDVLEWIHINFQQAVDKDEWETWPQFLRDVANISYDKRGQRDCLRRIDYLGFHSMFRGLEQSPDGQSWYLYVGRPY